MFEIVAILCLLAQPEICRAHLLPGHETGTFAECEALMPGLSGPGTTALPVGQSIRETTCRPMGPGLELSEIAPGVHVHSGAIAEPGPLNHGDVANIGVIVGGTSIAVIDTGGSRVVGEELYRAIRRLSSLPVSHVILTHVHPDHVFGASAFADAGAAIVAHPGFIRAFEDRQASYLTAFRQLIGEQAFLGTRPVQPDAISAEIDLGGRVLAIHQWPTSHTTTDLTVLDETSATLFAGDLVFDGHVPALDGSLPGWLDVLDRLAALEPDRVVPGHGGPVLSPEDALEPMRRYLQVLAEDTRNAIANGERIGDAVGHIAQGEAGEWQLFDLYNTRNATAAFTELEWE